MARKTRKPKQVTALTHGEASRKNIPTAEHQAVMAEGEREPVPVTYQRRNRDLDPQLVWRGKDEQDWQDLVVPAPPLFIQEKVHPKVLIDDLLRRSKEDRAEADPQVDLFADFNGLPDENARTEFYQHDANWANRMILGDSLQVMASLAEREGLRGKVQCIYIDPPYGIKFNSNFQWSTTSRDVKDGKAEHMTREPEQVKAFRDTWRDGIHSYLTYLRDRLTVVRDLLTESGSVFVQIGDENVHRVRAVMDEVFGDENCVSLVTCRVSSGTTKERSIKGVTDYLLWYCKHSDSTKFRRILQEREIETGMYSQVEEVDGSRRPMSTSEKQDTKTLPDGAKAFQKLPLHSPNTGDHDPRGCFGTTWTIPPTSHWRYSPTGFQRLLAANRVQPDRTALRSIYYHDDYPAAEISNLWADTGPEIVKSYVVQTNTRLIQRCVLMTTDPGDLVLDPTCGSGTTAYVAEQWGRRWITIDTSRVALALARARVMGARYPYYLLSDSVEGQAKEAELARNAPTEASTHRSIRHGFVYERVPHITLRAIANNAEIDVIHDEYQTKLEPLREALNKATGEQWQEWEIPRDANEAWTDETKQLHAEWWQQRIARQKDIDASIAAKADYERLYDKPFVDSKRVRVAGPFTVESLSPHRTLAVDEDGNAQADEVRDERAPYQTGNGNQDFTSIILENLRTAGVQQARKDDRISFTSLVPWPGTMVCADGRYAEADGGAEKRAAVFVGPEFGTVSRPDLVEAVREAADAGFDALIACAFNYDAQASDFSQLGRVPILKARMNADLHQAQDFKKTDRANLFVVFGEPDIEIAPIDGNGKGEQLQVKINGVDVYHPSTGEIRSDAADGIACWFVDTDYNQESFFVRHAYFLGARDPYKSLKTTLRAEIEPDAWATLNSDTSRPFAKPKSGRIAVKVINHLGDEVMKVFRV